MLRGNPKEKRATIEFEQKRYGSSTNGISLEYIEASSSKTELLIVAAIHGNEQETTCILSKALRNLSAPPQTCSVVLCAYPDGSLAGKRGNARGVDLNRNFPASNWTSEKIERYYNDRNTRDLLLSTGNEPASELETQALISLVETTKPQHVIALHGPLDCVDDPELSPLGKWLAQSSGMKLVEEIGYPVPGSFGSWAKEQHLHVITYELPSENPWQLFDPHLTVFTELLKHGLEVIDSN